MADTKDKLFDKAKVAVRSTFDDVELDSELNDLILSARDDLRVFGLIDKAKSSNEDDSNLITQAILLYVKSRWGYDNPDAERFGALYDELKNKLSVSTQFLQGEAYEI
ncbi:phage head-tail connector protein [Leuconostoc lactis]|uniref:phage head-tail connector protein n=1 Tax=Leuconostoc lactis TaxID=1246 RepID=UPI003D6A1931